MKRWQSFLVRILEDSFRAAGVRKATTAARFAVHTLATGKNPSQASKYRMANRVPPATFSGWLSEMDWPGFVEGINRWSRRNLKALLRAHPPDARGCVNIADVHQVEYDPDWPGRWRKTKRRVRPHLSRRTIAMRATAQNKSSIYASHWLVCALAWKSQGREWVVPYHFELVIGAKNSPDYHARQMCRKLRAIGVTPSSNVLDNYYQSAQVRDVFRKLGWRYRIRQKSRGSNAQLAVELPSNRKTRTTKLLAETIAHPEAQRLTRFDYQRGKYVVEFVRDVRVRLGSDLGETQLVLIARATHSPKGHGWAFEDNGSLIIACTPEDDVRAVMRDYRTRWCIESWFRSIVNAAPNHVPKTVPSHVFAFLGHAIHINLASTKHADDQIAAQGGPIRGVSASQWTLVESASEVLGEDPLTPSFAVD